MNYLTLSKKGFDNRHKPLISEGVHDIGADQEISKGEGDQSCKYGLRKYYENILTFVKNKNEHSNLK